MSRPTSPTARRHRSPGALLRCTPALMFVLACAPRGAVVAPFNAPSRSASPAAATPLRVMSFNLRYNNPGDGVNAWPNRKDWVAALITEQRVDMLGVQEALAPMLADLDARLPGYARIGVGRTDGKLAGEFSAIFYRPERLALLDSGTFWLSPTPSVVGSKGWDAALERIATWGRFRDQQSGCVFMHLNTHFDHIGEQARQESARLIRRKLVELGGGAPLVVTGDLNSDPSSGAYRTFTRDSVAGAPPLRDAMLVTRTPAVGPNSTWNAFTAIEPGKRIDYVMVSDPVLVESHHILTDSRDGRFPSDHLPVRADLTPCGTSSQSR